MELTIYKANDMQYDLTITDEDGNPVDISNDTLYFTVKKSVNDDYEDAKIKKEITEDSDIDTVGQITDPTNGKAVLTLTREDTELEAGRYYYDVLGDIDGNRKVIDRAGLVIKHTISFDIE